MQSLPEGLVYVLLFGALLFLQYLMKRFGPQPQPQPQAPQVDPDLGTLAQEQAWLEVPAVSTASDTRFERAEAPRDFPALAVRRTRRFSRNALMGTRRDVQNAVVIATVLGPCRAFEPHDSH